MKSTSLFLTLDNKMWSSKPTPYGTRGSIIQYLKYDPDPDVIIRMIHSGSKVNIRDGDGWTPLHHAISYSLENCSKVLIEHGTDVDARTNDGWTPLHMATFVRQPNIIGVLLKSGANPDPKDNAGVTPLGLTPNYIKSGIFGMETRQWAVIGLSDTEKAIYTNWRRRLMKKSLMRFYILGRFFQQKLCGILVGSRICRMMCDQM